jgi:hypothetical protein
MSEPLKVSDEAWLATALLHRDHPDREDFRLAEIHARARLEFDDERPGVWQHIVGHCVASNKPSPASYRMLHQTERGRRRLFHPGDPYHPGRRSGRTHPAKSDIPAKYWPLLEWYENEYGQGGGTQPSSASPSRLLGFVGAIAAFDLGRMSDAIRAGCEQVDESGW